MLTSNRPITQLRAASAALPERLAYRRRPSDERVQTSGEQTSHLAPSELKPLVKARSPRVNWPLCWPRSVRSFVCRLFSLNKLPGATSRLVLRLPVGEPRSHWRPRFTSADSRKAAGGSRAPDETRRRAEVRRRRWASAGRIRILMSMGDHKEWNCITSAAPPRPPARKCARPLERAGAERASGVFCLVLFCSALCCLLSFPVGPLRASRVHSCSRTSGPGKPPAYRWRRARSRAPTKPIESRTRDFRSRPGASHSLAARPNIN